MGFRTCFSDKTPHIQEPLTCQRLNLRLLPQNWHCLESKAISKLVLQSIYIWAGLPGRQILTFVRKPRYRIIFFLPASFQTSLEELCLSADLAFLKVSCGFKFTPSNLFLLIPLWIWGTKKKVRKKDKNTREEDIFLHLKDGRRDIHLWTALTLRSHLGIWGWALLDVWHERW